MTNLQQYGKKPFQTGLTLARNPVPLLLMIFSILIFMIAYFGEIEEYKNDPALTLLTAQAIIEHQTLYVDWYKDSYITDEAKLNRYYVDFNTDANIVKRNGHYYHYSIGTGILSVPFVWGANLLGKHMAVAEDEFATQNFISALLCALIFIVIYKICRTYLNQTSSLIISIISVLGSSLISILGVGLWNLNFTVLFNSLALLHLTRYESGKLKVLNPLWLGFLLVSAYICRPTAGFFITSVFVYLFVAHRLFFLRVAAVSIVAFVVFVVFSWFRDGQLLPSYYSPQKILSNLYTSSWLVGLYGNLLSPSRGLFSFTPYLILVFGIAVWQFRRLKEHRLFWLAVIWFCLHIIAVSTRRDWWGGHTYGPRFSTDLLPGLILVTVLVWQEISRLDSLRYKNVIATGYIVLGCLGIFIHSYQGLYNPYTKQWNKHPNIDNYEQRYLLSWQYPQFLASEASLRQRNLERHLNELPIYAPGDIITYTGGQIIFTTGDYVGDFAIFQDWFLPEMGWRWAKGETSRIIFRPGAIDPHKTYSMEVVAASLKAQKVGVLLNDTDLGHLTLSPFNGTAPETNTLTFSGALLEENSFNKIEFNLTGVSATEAWESRTEGMAFVSLRLYPKVDHQDGVYYFESEFYEDGFGSAEENWRWTDGVTSTVVYPLDDINIGKEYMMEISAGALGVQRVGVKVNDIEIGYLTFEGARPQTQTLTFTGHLLKAHDTNQIQLRIPDAAIPKDDSRRLGLALVSLKISPVE